MATSLVVELTLTIVDGAAQVVGEFSPVSDHFVEYGASCEAEVRESDPSRLARYIARSALLVSCFGVIGIVGEYGDADTRARAP